MAVSATALGYYTAANGLKQLYQDPHRLTIEPVHGRCVQAGIVEDAEFRPVLELSW